jgi:FkbM family methyltransferase
MKLAFPDGDQSWKFRDGLNWDSEQFEVAKRKIKNFRTCLDLGGHVGITSIRFAKHFEHVHAFEPVNGKYFKQNTKQFNNITLYEHAVSDHEGTVDMFINTNNSCAVIHEGIIDYLYSKNFVVEPTSFPCKAIDDYNFENVDFIKIDVEGYNIPVINGMKKLLENNNPIMHIEIAADKSYNQRFYKLMKELGYKEYAQVGKIDKFYERVQ